VELDRGGVAWVVFVVECGNNSGIRSNERVQLQINSESALNVN